MVNKLLVPQPLQPGDRIGVIAPAGGVRDNKLVDEGISVLEQLGFSVHYPDPFWPGSSYFADTDRKRGAEFNKQLADPGIKALVCMRGGYGCLRMLEYVDFDAVLENPKFLVGFSDITVLQNVLFARTGLLCLQGPVITTLPSTPMAIRQRLCECLYGEWQRSLTLPQCIQVQQGENCEGRLIGGNLASLVSLLGTRFDFAWDNAILFLEDVNEPLYRLDRLFSQLRLAGKFEHIRGILLGDFGITETSSVKSQPQKKRQQEVWNLVKTTCGNNKIPIWGDFPIGHTPSNTPLPLGAWTKMDCDNMKLHFSQEP